MKKLSNEQIETFLDKLDFSKIKGNLLPVVVQDKDNNEILMVAFANKEAMKKTLETGYAHYYSRSRDALWKKGETSGHVQEIERVLIDCDSDTILLKVKQEGAACHKGYYSCFFSELKNGEIIKIADKIFDPKQVYNK